LEQGAAALARDAHAGRLGSEADQLRVVARSRRESLRADVERLEEIRLACAVRPRDEHDPGLELELEACVRAEVALRDFAGDEGSGL
jgi:hypothetical protein